MTPSEKHPRAYQASEHERPDTWAHEGKTPSRLKHISSTEPASHLTSGVPNEAPIGLTPARATVKMPHAMSMPSTGLQALILCGPGSSFPTFTSNPDENPKAILPIANRPMVWYPIDFCHRMGITSRSLSLTPESWHSQHTTQAYAYIYIYIYIYVCVCVCVYDGNNLLFLAAIYYMHIFVWQKANVSQTSP